MKRLLPLLAIFSLGSLCAQSTERPYTRPEVAEQPRGKITAYATEQEATIAARTASRYFTPLNDWTRSGNSFSAPITIPFAWANRQVILGVGAASSAYQVRVNNTTIARNDDGNSPAEFNITSYIKEGRNTLEISLPDNPASADLESWKERPEPAISATWLQSQPTLRVRDVVTRTWRGAEGGEMMAQVGIVAKSSSLNPRTSRIYYELRTPAGTTAATGHQDVTLDMRREDTVRFLARIPDSLLWSTAHPMLYTLRVKTQHEGRAAEYLEMPLGFRSAELQQGHLVINGQAATLRTREVSPQISEEEILRLRGEGYNTLALRPGAVREGLYDFCDAQGMYVIAQAPIDTHRSGTSRRRAGNPSNDPARVNEYVSRAKNSYHTAKRHPSVVAFSLAEKSANGICLYETYLEMKRFGDTRPFIYRDAAGEWNSDKLALE